MADDSILEFAAVQADADFVANVKLALSLLWARRECTSFAVGSEAVNGSGGTLSAQQKSATAIYLGVGCHLTGDLQKLYPDSTLPQSATMRNQETKLRLETIQGVTMLHRAAAQSFCGAQLEDLVKEGHVKKRRGRRGTLYSLAKARVRHGAGSQPTINPLFVPC